MESIVGKDGLAARDSVDATDEALIVKSPGTPGRLFAAEFVSNMVIRTPS